MQAALNNVCPQCRAVRGEHCRNVGPGVPLDGRIHPQRLNDLQELVELFALTRAGVDRLIPLAPPAPRRRP